MWCKRLWKQLNELLYWCFAHTILFILLPQCEERSFVWRQQLNISAQLMLPGRGWWCRRQLQKKVASSVFFHIWLMIIDNKTVHHCSDASVLSRANNFYSATAMLSAVYVVVVCLYCIKTAKHRITQITPYDSPLTLVFWHQSSVQNSNGITPYRGDKCRWVG